MWLILPQWGSGAPRRGGCADVMPIVRQNTRTRIPAPSCRNGLPAIHPATGGEFRFWPRIKKFPSGEGCRNGGVWYKFRPTGGGDHPTSPRLRGTRCQGGYTDIVPSVRQKRNNRNTPFVCWRRHFPTGAELLCIHKCNLLCGIVIFPCCVNFYAFVV